MSPCASIPWHPAQFIRNRRSPFSIDPFKLSVAFTYGSDWDVQRTHETRNMVAVAPRTIRALTSPLLFSGLPAAVDDGPVTEASFA